MATMRRVPGPAGGAFTKALADLDKTNVKVGWFSTSKYNDKNQTPVAYVAAINELGPNARPFMGPAADANEAAWADHMLKASRQIVKGNITVAQGLEGLGLVVAADIRKAIDDVNSPPLADRTIAARKARGNDSVKPLQDLGYMIATVTSLVEEGNTE